MCSSGPYLTTLDKESNLKRPISTLLVHSCLMSICVYGFNSQKAKFYIGIASLACWVIPLAKFICRERQKGLSDDKYIKRKAILQQRPSIQRLVIPVGCVILSLYCLWDPWTLSWLEKPRFMQPYAVRQSYELGCNAAQEIERGEVVGRGFFSAVREGEFDGSKIAIKYPNPRKAEFSVGTRRQFMVERLWAEKSLLRQLQFSPHIVRLLGGCGEEIYLEFLETPLEQYVTERKANFTEMEVMEMWLGVAQAVDALHRAAGGPIIHQDIKPDQFLFGSNKELKLTDFNGAHQLSHGLQGVCVTSLSERWKSPEQIDGGLVTTKSDVYSMGFVFFYIFTGWKPEKGGQQKLSHIDHPELPEDMPQYLKNILERIWQRNPEDRPSAREVEEELEVLRFGSTAP